MKIAWNSPRDPVIRHSP